MGGRRLSLAALARRRRERQPGGGAPPRLCRDHAGAASGVDHARSKPPDIRPMDIVYSIALHRSEEHTSELQSLMRISYAVFCLKKKQYKKKTQKKTPPKNQNKQYKNTT